MAESGWRPPALRNQFEKFPQLIACGRCREPDLAEISRSTCFWGNGQHAGSSAPEPRYSGTEPKCRLMLETDTRHKPAELSRYAWQVCELIQRETGTPRGAKIEILNVSDGGLMPRPE